MADLMQHVKAYLDGEDTDYAIMIEGPWGSGKTFFWRKKIVPEIESRKGSRQDQPSRLFQKGKARENLQPVYVSLYGITRPDDIDRAVLLELNPWLGNKTMAKIGTVSRPLLKAFRLDPDSIKIDPKHWINLTDVVLCFDDLERCSIGVSDVLGRINQYVEHEGIKTIILCNEDGIRKEEMEQYRLIKEKVIGRSVQFEIDHAAVLDALIKKHEATGPFHDFLVGHRDLILDLFRRSGWKNIRALKHALSHLSTVFLAIDEKAQYAAAARKAMIGMILPLTFEYELGGFDQKLVKDIATQNPFRDAAWTLTDKGAPSPSKLHEIKYFDLSPDDHPPSSAVADLITTGLLDFVAFKEQMEVAYAQPNELESALRMIYGKVWNLSDEEFARNYDVLWQAVADRRFSSLADYFGLYLATHYWAKNRLLDVDPSRAREKLVEAIRDSVNRHLVEHDDDLEANLPMITGHVQPEIVHFRDLVIGENAKLRQKGDEQKSLEFLRSIKDGDSDGMRKLFSDFCYVPVFDYMPVAQVVDAIWSLPNPLKSLLVALLQRRYLRNAQPPTHELAGIRRLHEALVVRLAPLGEKPRPLSHAAVEQISSALAEVVARLTASAARAADAKT